MTTTTARPLRRMLGMGFGLAMVFGTMVGVGILRLPGTVAAAPLWHPATVYPRAGAILILAVFTGIHWIGLRIGSSVTAIISVAIGVTLIILIAGCFLTVPVSEPAAAPLATSAASLPLMSITMMFAIVPALRAVLTAYDGWYAPIYMAEENANPARTLPRAIIGGTLLVVALYLLINVALLRVLPLSVLAASELPAADAARSVLPRGGAILVTVISLLTILSLLSNNLLMAPRVLFGIGRDGLLTEKAAVVSQGGTPRTALALTSVLAAVVILSGSFEQIIALFAVLFLVYYVAAFLAVFVLRYRLPALPRPYKALGYPLSTAIVLIGSIVFLIAAVFEDPRSGVIAAAFLACCAPAYAWRARNRRLRAAIQLA
jgi:basic amino acid/polyamine antiporter, APA family